MRKRILVAVGRRRWSPRSRSRWSWPRPPRPPRSSRRSRPSRWPASTTRAQQEVLRDNTVAAELSDLDAPENRFERDQGRLLEVYLPVPTRGGQTLLFETYSRYSSVTANAGAMWRQFVPITVGALLLLTLLQLPLASGRRPGGRTPASASAPSRLT